MSNKNKRAQALVIEEKLEEMLLWYAANSTSEDLPELAVDTKTYRGKVLRWFIPLLPGENPLLIEEHLGDHWTLRIEPTTEKIQVFIP